MTIVAATVGLLAVGDSTITLQNVDVVDQVKRDFQMKSSQSSVRIGHEFLENNFAGSLMQT